MQSSTVNRTAKNFANSALAQWTLEFRGISHFFADGALHILVAMATSMSSGFLAPSQVSVRYLKRADEHPMIFAELQYAHLRGMSSSMAPGNAFKPN